MHLQAIKIKGFKSFPDGVEIRLEPGVAVVVGPNGSGKSNVVDAVVWAAGSLSPTELRAEKPDDVLFAGSGDRGKTDFAEVELLIDCTDGGPLDYTELSIARRLHRGGEGQYLLNRTPVRRTDIVELLADLGLGSGMHSVIGQGRVEEILGSSAERRRELLEEAAGLGKFKRRKHRAELKLARVAVQVERARDVEEEVRKRLRPLALQATAAERAEKLQGEIRRLRARAAELDLAAIAERRAEADERRSGAAIARKGAGERLESILGERDRAEEELADAAGRREAATSALYRLRSAGERLGLRREGAEGLLAAVASDLGETAPEEAASGPSPEELEHTALETASAARTAAAERDSLDERASLVKTRLSALERSLAEREGLPPAARALAEEGERLALALLEVEAGYERAVAAGLAWRASALLADDPQSGLALLERARAAGLGSLSVVLPREDVSHDDLPDHVRARPGGEQALALLAGIQVVEADELARAAGPAVTLDGHGYDPVRGELWFAGETAEAVLLELEARRRALALEVRELEAAAVAAASAAEEAEGAAKTAAVAYAKLGPRRPRRRANPLLLRAIEGHTRRLVEALTGALEIHDALEPKLRARADAGGVRTGELAAALRSLAASEAELRAAATEASERTAAIDVELARLDAEAAEAQRRLDEAGAEPAVGDDREEIALKLERADRRLEALGRVNPLAKEEYEQEKERLTELATQREDLEESLAELERLRAELTETVERRFAETFATVAEHFGEVAGTLFPGGEGRLTLTEPEDEEDAAAGIEIELRPAGKRVTRLSLLSGGEKALGAIAFLFSLFLARPSAFYLLDEVEAALDDANIGRFVELLRRYADRAQFVVITHQKRTMEAADILYGVTMAADGVSQVVSRRLPREKATAAA
jgi:chromosome segregation protein